MIEKSALDLAPGETGEIVSLGGGKGLQSRLRSLGLAEGQRVMNVSRIHWGGPIILLVNRAQIAVGRGMARRILVRLEGGEPEHDE
jgi:ferrous iron transport protein A